MCKRLYLFVNTFILPIQVFYSLNLTRSLLLASSHIDCFSGSDEDQGKLLISDIELACADLETLPSPGKLDGGWVGVVVPMDKFVCGRFYAYLWLYFTM